MAGHERARHNLRVMECNSGNEERAIKHRRISASAGYTNSMTNIQLVFKMGHVQGDVYEQTMKAYNDSCAKMRSKARDDALAAYRGNGG
jgi:hypothetical protein